MAVDLSAIPDSVPAPPGRTIDEVHQVGLFDPGVYDAVATISADDAIDGLLTLVRRCGVLSAPSHVSSRNSMDNSGGIGRSLRWEA